VMVAVNELYYEIVEIEDNIARRHEILKTEEEAKIKKIAMDQKKVQDEVAVAKETEADVLKKQKREEFLKKMQEKLREEREMLAIGRHELNSDIKRHQGLMLTSIDGLKNKVKAEREEFLNAVVKEVEAFRLPSADAIFGTHNEALITQLKELSDECLKLTS